MGRLIQTFAILVTLSMSSSKPADRLCGGKAADVVFILDASSSIWEPNFHKQLDFVSNVIDVFDVGLSGEQTQVGLVTFSDHSAIQFHLGEHAEKEVAKKAVKSVGYLTGGTNTSDALRTARVKMFSVNHSPREDIVRVAVVITDGQSEDTVATYKQAMALKSAGIQVFAVGVGFGIDERELEVIASSPSREFVFTVDDYGALNSIKDKLAIRTCEVTRMVTSPTTPSPVYTEVTSSITSTSTSKLTTTTEPRTTSEPAITKAVSATTEASTSSATRGTTMRSATFTSTEIPHEILGDQPGHENPSKVCQGKPAEVFFLLDSSSSILLEDFEKQTIFVQNMARIFDIGPKRTRVGASTFSDFVHPVFDLDRYKSKVKLSAAVKDIPYLGGGTNTAEAIRDMRTRAMAPEVIRQEIAHIGIVLTDGQSRDPKLTAEQAQLAKKQGIYLFAIGIGDDVDMQELADIASEPSERFVFHVSNYDALESMKEILAIRTCEVEPSDEKKGNGVCPEDPTDVMFVYDSAKMGAQKAAAILPLLDNVVSRLPMSETTFQFGLLANTCPSDDLRVPMTSDRTTLTRVTQGTERRDLSSLFQELRMGAFSPENGGRTNARHVALVFIDSELEDHDKIITQAKRTKSRGIEVFVVGIGDDVSLRDVRALVSGPLSNHYVRVPSFKELSSYSEEVQRMLCQDDKFILENSPVH